MADYVVGSSTKDSSGGGGDANILKLGDTQKIRLIDLKSGKTWKQHWVAHVDDPQQGKSVVCPGVKECPLCQKNAGPDGKQRFGVSVKYATNVWDYGSESVKVLIGGKQIFDEFHAAETVGFDPLASDWIIHKTGTGQKTKYKLQRGDASPFEGDQLALHSGMHDLEKYDKPASIEKIFALLEESGWDYDTLEGPSFTLEEALALVIPFGQCKGQTVEQAMLSNEEWCEWFHGVKIEDGEITNPFFVAIQTVMEERGMVGPIEGVVTKTSAPPTPGQESPATTGLVSDLVTMIGPDDSEQDIPPSAVEALEAAGFTRKPEPVPEPAAPEPTMITLRGPDGSVMEYPIASKDALLAAGFTEELTGPAPVEETPAPEAIGDGEMVSVTVGDSAPASMPFSAAKTAMAGGVALEFQNERVAAYVAYLADNPVPVTPPPANSVQSPEEQAMHAGANPTTTNSLPADPEKPFECQVPGCGKAYKLQGGLTAHMNRNHGSEDPTAASVPETVPITPPPHTPDPDFAQPTDPVPAAAPATPVPTSAAVAPPQDAATANGAGEDHEVVLARVKTLIGANPTTDYTKLLDLFDQIAGKRDISKFTTAELVTLEEHINAGLEKA